MHLWLYELVPLKRYVVKCYISHFGLISSLFLLQASLGTTFILGRHTTFASLYSGQGFLRLGIFKSSNTRTPRELSSRQALALHSSLTVSAAHWEWVQSSSKLVINTIKTISELRKLLRFPESLATS
jgi:hypothetical protein